MQVRPVYDMMLMENSKDCEGLQQVLSEVLPVDNLGPVIWYTGCTFEHNLDGSSIKIV